MQSVSINQVREGHNPSRALRVLGQHALLLGAIALGISWAPNVAKANSYNGLLYGGQTYAIVAARAYAANSTVASQSWTAPSGVQFGGFAYTAASFDIQNSDVTGGLSAGFVGAGGSAPTDLNFPWTRDCSISEATPRVWIATGTQVTSKTQGPGGTSGSDSCLTGGRTTGWNYDNIEAESSNPAADPNSDYQTLALRIWCARDANCASTDSASYAVTNLSGHFDDSVSQPSGTAGWSPQITTGRWYQTNTGQVKLQVSANDPAGVCSMNAELTGPTSVGSGPLGNQNPSVTDVGGIIGNEFTYGLDPCWTGTADNATWTLPAGLNAGTYSVDVQASNPGNYEAQGFTYTGAPTVATAGVIQIDDALPQLAWQSPPTGWTAQTVERLDVTVGPSGLSSLTCTVNGKLVAAALQSGNVGSAGTTTWAIPTLAIGVDVTSCTATNGDTNPGLTSSTARTFSVDSMAPTVAFSDPGYTPGSWTNTEQTVRVISSVGPSGLAKTACTLDGVSMTLGSGSELVVRGDSIATGMPHVLSCYAQAMSGVSNQSNPDTFDVAIDTNQPTVTFSGAPADGSWVAGTPTVVVTGGELNPVTLQPDLLSGIASISCSVNGRQVTTPPLTAGFATSFQLTANGPNRISCVPTTVAGSSSAPFTETVLVDNPARACPSGGCGLSTHGSSPLIDGGADPYSNGPSQSSWSRSANPVTITADPAAGQAPIISISCTGALTGTWPLSDLNRDAAGGERITITVPPPGGQLSCTAQDAAANIYQLGAYQFEEDNTAPGGHFDQLSASTPDDIRVTVDDPGGNLASGVGYVRVYATSTRDGAVYNLGLAHLVKGSSDVYDVNLNDANAPAGTYRFDAEVGDIAGNTADLTAGAQGSQTVWQLPLRANTELTMTADGVHGTVDGAVPSVLQANLPNTSSRIPGASSKLTPITLQGAIRPGPALMPLFRAARVTALQTRHHRRSRRSAVVTVPFGTSLTLRGRLYNLKQHNAEIPHARVDVWAVGAGGRPALIGHTFTSRSGTYKFRVRAGATREVYAAYVGSHRLRAAVAQIRERIRGRVTISGNQAAAGKLLRIIGRVKGGHIPSGGLNVTLKGKIVGYPGSQQLGTIRTDSAGRYHYAIRLPAATRGLTYRLWLVVPSRLNPRWPFLSATSTVLTRRVA